VKYFVAPILLCITLFSQAQSITPYVFNTDGATLKGSTVQIEISIGEPITTTLYSANNIISQGLLQPNYNLMTSIYIEEKNITIKYCPNPTTDNIYIETDAVYNNIQIFDMTGKLVQIQ